MPGSKKKDKNAKDTGGVFAAVTKHGATKFTTAKDPIVLPESPPSPMHTPELKPATPASIPSNGNPAPGASPLLEGVAGTSIATSTAPSMGEWTRNHGPLAGSPNLISLMGESPPTQPSSYEDSKAQPWLQHRAHVNSYAHSASPPVGARRPLSFHMDSHFAAVNDIRSQASSPPGIRRSSMHSPFVQPRVGSHHPLPHQPQAHFYGAPDIDFDLNSTAGLKAGERGYFFGFDTWPASNLAYTQGSNNVAIAGYEGGLDVYAVSKRGIDPLASLKGLRGGVYHAKILPWAGTGEQNALYPLVAVVVHGPVLPAPTPEITVDPHLDAAASPRLDGINTPQSDTNQRPINVGKTLPTIEAYQTTVEVYSLKTHSLISTLLQAPRIPIKSSVQNPLFRTPSVTGALQIRADHGSIVVSSGTTGECWIFRQLPTGNDAGIEFRCVGKVWTSLQHAIRGDATPEEERSHSPSPARQNPQTPILAVDGRWLAYCPPAPSSLIALNAAIGVPIDGKAPGLSTLTSPVLPTESSDVDQPISDGMMNRIMRETTQEVIQGARWVGKQGMQLWNNYWKQPSPQGQGRSSVVGSPPWSAGYPARADSTQFPPTYGVAGQAITKDPGLVSILDLEGLENSTSIHHVTTFKVPLGCSFLSFSPTGLSIFTASTKGDVQTVWDLMQIQHSRSSLLQNSPSASGHSTRVRQIAQFSRMTVARIVDVAWARPNGERIAMVTEKGTVHLLDMPPSAYTWPPPRRRTKAEEAKPGASESASSAVSMASTALSSAYDAARPLINRRRRSSSNANATSSLIDHASYGGKVLAAGISHSLGNAGTAINQLRHSGDNRVSLPMSNQIPGLSCVMWITGRKYHTLFVAGDGLLRSFPSKTRTSGAGNDRVRTARVNRYKDFKLRPLPNDILAPSVKRLIEPDEDLEFGNPNFEGDNTLVLNPRAHLSPREQSLGPESSIPQAEIETSAPYQPFHTDRRVALYEYGIEAVQPALDAALGLLGSTTLEDRPAPPRGKSKKKHAERVEIKPEAWAFGLSIDAVKLDIGASPIADEDFTGSTDDHRALPASAMERVLQVGENDEQIVVTTRRRRGGNRVSELDEDGFFEDDCEVLDFADQRV
ncbi:hypothetical protein BX600DRAFT_224044 [Xylariales sp. PMI_506]|nr:hypothetical protein BX600DRAFT_224044 [Xylariales sp. PMI_506]